MTTLERLLTLVEDQPLSRSLPTALRIATGIGDEQLASWIRLELMGYLAENPAMNQDTVVPEYRGVPGRVLPARLRRAQILRVSPRP